MSKCKFVPLKHSELHHIYHALGDGKKANKIKAKLRIAMNTTCVKTENALNKPELDGNVKDWISIKDKLPTYGEPVLLKINGVTQKLTWNLDGSDNSKDWFELYDPLNAYSERGDHHEHSFFVGFEKDIK